MSLMSCARSASRKRPDAKMKKDCLHELMRERISASVTASLPLIFTDSRV